MFTWDGWSLVTPRPGRTIQTKEDNGVFKEEPGEVKEEPYEDFPLIAVFKAVDKSLPPLRFGQKYQIRVRVVDIAGNSRPLTTTQDNEKKREITYHRFEPVASPILYPRVPFKGGEAAERMVIRTYHNEEDYPPTDETNERHVVPPKTSQLMAETHGAFDEFLMRGEFQEAYEISLREKGMLNEKDETNIIKKQDDDLIIIENKQINLPYLPDVLARGVVLQDLPINGSTLLPEGLTYVNDNNLKISALKIPFYGPGEKWPNAKPFRISINGEEKGISWDSNKRLLTISLEKAYKGNIRYSCYFHKEDLELMGLWDWMKSPGNANILAKYALNGCHWMLTPYRELTLVHAVMRPLAVPKIVKITSIKEIRETFAYINANFIVNANSTGKITVLSYWDDILDDPVKDSGARNIAKEAVAFEYDVPEGSSDNIVFSEKDCTFKKHEFGDTRHRKVKYRLKATSRFTDCYDPNINHDEFTIEGDVYSKPVNILSSARPDVPSVNYIIPTFRWEQDFQPGKYFKRKRIGGGLRVYMDRPWYSSGDGELLGVVLANQDPKEAINSFITLWGMDPVRKSKEIQNRLTIADFKPYKSATRLSLEEFMEKPDIDNSFDVAAFKPFFDNEKGLWCCDVQLKSEKIKSYFPFIKLALARYQPNSVKDAHLSNVVQTDFIQVSNDRELTVKYSPAANDQTGKSLDVSLEGYGPNYGKDVKPIGNDVKISIERQESGNKLLWEPVKDKEDIEMNLSFQEFFCRWNTETPLTLPTADGKYRLVVKEFEKYKTGEEIPNFEFKGKRMVYMDVIEFSVKNGIINIASK